MGAKFGCDRLAVVRCRDNVLSYVPSPSVLWKSETTGEGLAHDRIAYRAIRIRALGLLHLLTRWGFLLKGHDAIVKDVRH